MLAKFDRYRTKLDENIYKASGERLEGKKNDWKSERNTETKPGDS